MLKYPLRYAAPVLSQTKFQAMWNAFYPYDKDFYSYSQGYGSASAAENHNNWRSSKHAYASMRTMVCKTQKVLKSYCFDKTCGAMKFITIDDMMIQTTALAATREALGTIPQRVKAKRKQGSVINAMGDALTGLLYGINIGWESASNCDIIKDMIQSLVFDDKYMGSREINRSDMPTGNLILFLDRGYSDDDTLSYLRSLGIKYLATKKRNNLNPVGYAVKNPDQLQQIVDENGPRMFMKFENANKNSVSLTMIILQ